MISFVNGYVCTSGCDIDAARKGRDPQHPNDNPVVARERAVREGRIAAGLDDRRDDVPDPDPQQRTGRPPPGLGAVIDRFV